MIEVAITFIGSAEVNELGSVERVPDMLDLLEEPQGVARVVQRRWSKGMQRVVLVLELLKPAVPA